MLALVWPEDGFTTVAALRDEIRLRWRSALTLLGRIITDVGMRKLGIRNDPE